MPVLNAGMDEQMDRPRELVSLTSGALSHSADYFAH